MVFPGGCEKIEPQRRVPLRLANQNDVFRLAYLRRRMNKPKQPRKV